METPARRNQSSGPYLIPKRGLEIIRSVTTTPVRAMKRIAVAMIASAPALIGASESDI